MLGLVLCNQRTDTSQVDLSVGGLQADMDTSASPIQVKTKFECTCGGKLTDIVYLVCVY